MLGAMGAAVDLAVGFHTMSDDAALAMLAARRHGVDSALEAVEGLRLTALRDLERLVVIVPANLASRRGALLLLVKLEGTQAASLMTTSVSSGWCAARAL
jgi:hypothetical protein